jgi:hypothetical protein
VTQFEFVEALPAETRGHQLDPVIFEFAEALRARPGEWAKYPIATSPSWRNTLVWSIRNTNSRTPTAFRSGGFDARQRGGVLYVRYVGEANKC